MLVPMPPRSGADPTAGSAASAVFVLAVFLGGCLRPSEPAPTGENVAEVTPCRPTLARMVPPQFVVDYVLGEGNIGVSREQWASDKNYLGNDSLWLTLPRDGRVTTRQLTVVAFQLVPGDLEVSARRIDGGTGSVKLERDLNPGGGPRDRAVTISFSSPGCWEIDYRLAKAENLRFIVEVAP